MIKELTGTEKQIKWATSLRLEKTSKIDALIQKIKKISEQKELEDGMIALLVDIDPCLSLNSALLLGRITKPLSPEKVTAILETLKKWLNSKSSAKWWIELSLIHISEPTRPY